MRLPRYLRFTNFVAKKGFGLDLSEIEIRDSDGVPITLTATANKTPSSGSLTNLNDGLTVAGCAFSPIDTRGLIISYDRGTDTVVSASEILLGSGGTQDTFPLAYSIMGSNDNIAYAPLSLYTLFYNNKKPYYPGAFALQSLSDVPIKDTAYNFEAYRSNVSLITNLPTGQLVYTRLVNTTSGHARPNVCVPLRSGKWYFEMTGGSAYFGIVGRPDEISNDINLWDNSGAGPNSCIGFYFGVGYGVRKGGTNTISLSRPATVAEYEIPYGVCIDLDALTLTLRRQDVTQGGSIVIDPSPTGEYYPAIQTDRTLGLTVVLNMGEVPFRNTVPAGYEPLINYKAAITAFESLSEPFEPAGQVQTIHKGPSVWPGVLKSKVVKIRHSPIVLRPERIGYIKGVVFIDADPDVPVRRFVTLMDSKSKSVVACVWSNPLTGTYQFDHVDMTRKYFTWTYDPSGLLSPTITGPMVPVVMPIYA